MRDLCNRVPTWTPLSGWVRKLFVHLLRQQQSGDLCLSHFSCFHPEVSVLSSCLHIATWTASGESYWYIWEITGSGRGPPQGFRVRSLRNTNGRWDFELCNLHVNLYTELTFMHQLNGICAQMALELKILVKRKLLMPLAIWLGSSVKTSHRVLR